MTWDFQQCGMCDQQRLWPACAFAQSDQSLCLSPDYSMNVQSLNEQHFEFLSLKGSCTGLSESTLVKMSHCWKSQVMAQIITLLLIGKDKTNTTYWNKLLRFFDHFLVGGNVRWKWNGVYKHATKWLYSRTELDYITHGWCTHGVHNIWCVYNLHSKFIDLLSTSCSLYSFNNLNYVE